MAEKAVRSAASVRALDGVVDALAATGAVSGARVRQLRMVVGMWDRALGQWPEGVRRPSRSVVALFSRAALETFWGLAVEGLLRVPGRGVGERLPVASQRVVRDCLGILGGEVVPGRVLALPVVGQQELKPAVGQGQLVVLYRKLVDLASDAPVERAGVSLSLEDRVRLLAMVAVVLDTGARSGELAAQSLGDLGDGLVTLRSTRRPQNGDRLPVVEKAWPLQAGTVVALRRWLRVREALVRPLEGSDPGALWVSLRANQWQPQPGFPLRAQGVRKAYARGAVALNWVMAGGLGWEPLPEVLERLTRTVRSALGEEPRQSPRRPRGSGVVGRPRRRASDEEIRSLIAVPGMTVDEIARAGRISLTDLYEGFPEIRSRPRARRRV